MDSNFLVVTTDVLQGVEITSYKGVVSTNAIAGTGLFSDIGASFTDVFGGKSKGYRRYLNEIREAAMEELIKQAKEIGGNAVVGFSIDFDEISGQGKQMFMVSATGTAVKAKFVQDMSASKDDVSQEMLSRKLKVAAILKDLPGNDNQLTPDRWKTISEMGDSSCLEVVGDCFFKKPSDAADFFESYLRRIETEKARDYLYSNIDKVEAIVLIQKLDLFSPSHVLDAMNAGKRKEVLGLLDADKPSYSVSDYKLMCEICRSFSSLPESVEYVNGKAGTFSKKSTRLWYCSCKSKNPEERETCEMCGRDKKGFSRNERAAISKFIMKTRLLGELLQAKQRGEA